MDSIKHKLAIIGGVTVLTLATAFLTGVVAFERKSKESTPTNASSAQPKKFAVVINRPSGPPCVRVESANGKIETVACSTCHATRPANPLNREPKDLDEFHQDMVFNHGSLSCLSCHNSSDYDKLKAADGASIEYVNVMQLCGQCHGPQMRDYEHGTHGGMTGYWDLNQGPRQRNNCVDCHHPHAPQFPHMQPTFKPRDRFLNDTNEKHANGHESNHE